VVHPLRKGIEYENITDSQRVAAKTERKETVREAFSHAPSGPCGAMCTGDPTLHGHPQIQITESRERPHDDQVNNSIQVRSNAAHIKCLSVKNNGERGALIVESRVQDKEDGRLLLMVYIGTSNIMIVVHQVRNRVSAGGVNHCSIQLAIRFISHNFRATTQDQSASGNQTHIDDYLKTKVCNHFVYELNPISRLTFLNTDIDDG